jgi:hypothetical protein
MARMPPLERTTDTALLESCLPTSFGVVPRVGGTISSGCRDGVKLVLLGGGFPHAFALEGEPVGVVNKPVENGIGDGGVADNLVPVFDGQLACHHG